MNDTQTQASMKRCHQTVDEVQRSGGVGSQSQLVLCAEVCGEGAARNVGHDQIGLSAFGGAPTSDVNDIRF